MKDIIVTRQCLNCGEEIQSRVYEDKLGMFCSCPLCESSFDIDLTEKEKNFMEDNKMSMVIEEKLEVKVWDPSCHIVSYYVNCFDRMLYVMYREEAPYFMLQPKTLEKMLDDAYFKWHEDENGDTCCEEFMLSQLDEEIRNHIITVMYDIDEEYEED